jgi:3',5'-cyclic AMP phosphodiesterase CpdA
MFIRIGPTFWVITALALSLAAGCSDVAPFPDFIATSSEPDSIRSNEIVFLSDTQAPLWVETLAIQEDMNRASTGRLFEDIHDRRPAAVFLLGDVVNLGYDDDEWGTLASLVEELRKDSVPVNALMGNHDVMLDVAGGEKRFQERFPSHRRTGYVRIVDSLAVVLLNSNFGTMDDVALESQQQWYEQTMTDLARDRSILGIIVTCHHSPYSNSMLVGSSLESRERFVTRYLAEPKARLFMSGHAHVFEHFRIKGKDLAVIGGGGGLQHPFYSGIDQRFPDLSPTHRKPKFHYTIVRREGNWLEVTVRRLDEDKRRTVDYYAFTIPLGTTSRPPSSSSP